MPAAAVSAPEWTNMNPYIAINAPTLNPAGGSLVQFNDTAEKDIKTTRFLNLPTWR